MWTNSPRAWASLDADLDRDTDSATVACTVNEETTTAIDTGVDPVSGPYLLAWIPKSHTSDVYITHETHAYYVAQKLAAIINTSGDIVAGRFGPDQSGVITAQVGGGSSYGPDRCGWPLHASSADGSLYGKLGNLDGLLVTQGRTKDGQPGPGQAFNGWLRRDVPLLRRRQRTRYHVELPFADLTVHPAGFRRFAYPDHGRARPRGFHRSTMFVPLSVKLTMPAELCAQFRKRILCRFIST
jgi:hypothetical protein